MLKDSVLITLLGISGDVKTITDKAKNITVCTVYGSMPGARAGVLIILPWLVR